MNRPQPPIKDRRAEFSDTWNGHTYILRFDLARPQAALLACGHWASNDSLIFSWRESAAWSYQIRKAARLYQRVHCGAK